MRSSRSLTNIRKVLTLLIPLAFGGFPNTATAISANEASRGVKLQSCKENMTVEQALDQSVKSNSQQDIGWHTFQEDGYFDVERAVLINKGVELHYRWRVELNGNITPENDRTEQLCKAHT